MKNLILPLFLISLFLAGCITAGEPLKPAPTPPANTINNSNASDGGTVNPPTPGETKTFEITAKKFEFVPGTIEVNQGDTVVLNITSTDVTHGISIPEFGVNETLPPNQTVTIQFVANEAGTFPFSCSVFCGADHGNMKGTLIVK